MLYDTLYHRLLVRLDPETAHGWALAGLQATLGRPRISAGLARRTFAPELALDALGRQFASPLGVAAGLDKNARAVTALGALGFGSVEVGTVTPRPQAGNPRPRIVRATVDRALVNAMGFPNDGAEAVAARLGGRAAPRSAPGVPVLGVNVSKNRDTALERAAEDLAAVAGRLAPLADFVVLNVSSPNTPGLRALERVSQLEPVLTAVQEQVAATPLLVKISPDLSDVDVDAVAELAVSHRLAGVIATNTSVDRGLLSPAARAAVADFSGGGVSGPPLAARSLQVLSRLHAALAGTGAIVVSVGGVSDSHDVWARILAGATLVQVYTGFVYGGPAWPARINHELAARVRAAGCTGIAELVGADPPRNALR